MSTGLERRVAFVTGAAGDIGRAVALLFARRGAAVVVFDRRVDLLEETKDLCLAEGATVLALGVDQTDRAAVEAGVAQAADELGAPSVLFANAGYGRFSTFLAQPENEWRRHVDVNLTGTFHMTQVVARRMVEARAGGAIVINASSGAVQYTDLLGAYCATKAGLRMLAMGMASELGNHRIRVNVVMPGVIETGMTEPMLAGPDGDGHRSGLTAQTPLGRLGTAEDVANLVGYLVSDDAAFITGQSILVDGGQVIHGHPQWYRTDYRVEHDENWAVAR